MGQASIGTIESAYDTYADLLYRLALAHLQHHEDAADAVQDVFVKFASAPRTFRDHAHERAWFVRVTLNRCHDLQRRRRVRQHASLDECESLPVEVDTIRPAVLEAIDTLPQRYKTVLVLHYLEGFSVEETAHMLHVSISAVKMRISRAKDKLKAAYNKEDFYV